MYNQKIGGIAGIIESILYVIGFVFLFSFMRPMMDESMSEIEKLGFILENKTIFQVWHLLIYVIFGLVLIPLAIAINENFQSQSLFPAKAAPVLGFIWSGLVISSGMIVNVGLETVSDLFAQDPSAALQAWKTIEAIQNALGGGVEVVGGLWVFLISLYGIKERVFPKPLNYLGLIVGGAGILTMIPGLKDLGAVFGLTQIIWFAWIGVYMLNNKKLAAQQS